MEDIKEKIIEKHGGYHDGFYYLDQDQCNRAMDEFAVLILKELVIDFELKYNFFGDMTEPIERIKNKIKEYEKI